jgi:hypothetical protein
MGLIAFIGFALLFVGMGWLGSKGLWRWAAMISVPFFGVMIWLEITTSGGPIFADPYGIMLLIIIFGPLALGWLAFFGGLALRRAELRQTSQLQE